MTISDKDNNALNPVIIIHNILKNYIYLHLKIRKYELYIEKFKNKTYKLCVTTIGFDLKKNHQV